MSAQRTPATKSAPELEIARLASVQYGLLTRAQAHSFGVSDSMIRTAVLSGRYVRVHRGVYRMAGSPEGWEQSLMAAVLLGGAGACASHRAAAALLRLDGVESKILEISVDRNVRVSGDGLIVHRVAPLLPGDITRVSGIPVTEPSLTLIDLAGVLNPDRFELALEDALRRRLVTLARLRWRIRTDMKGKAGAAALRKLVRERPAGTPSTESALEVQVLRVLRKAGFPPPERQLEVRTGGRLIARVDFAYPELNLAIEVDGYKWHSGRNAWERDRARGNALQAAGWQLLRVTSEQLKHPDELIRIVGGFFGR